MKYVYIRQKVTKWSTLVNTTLNLNTITYNLTGKVHTFSRPILRSLHKRHSLYYIAIIKIVKSRCANAKVRCAGAARDVRNYNAASRTVGTTSPSLTNMTTSLFWYSHFTWQLTASWDKQQRIMLRQFLRIACLD